MSGYYGIWRLIMQSKNWIFLQEKLSHSSPHPGTYFCTSRHEIRAISVIPFFGQIIYIYQKAFHEAFLRDAAMVIKTAAEIVGTGAS
jgi:hypothetical protein